MVGNIDQSAKPWVPWRAGFQATALHAATIATIASGAIFCAEKDESRDLASDMHSEIAEVALLARDLLTALGRAGRVRAVNRPPAHSGALDPIDIPTWHRRS